MATFRSIPEAIHAWAHGAEDVKAGNVFSRGPVIFSYGQHFPMARLIGNVVVITTSGYSSSTARHMGHVRQAVSHLRRYYCSDVENPFNTDALERTMRAIVSHLETIPSRRLQHTKQAEVHAASNLYQEVEKLRELEKELVKAKTWPEGWRKWGSLRADLKRQWTKLGGIIGVAREDATAALATLSKAQQAARKKKLKAFQAAKAEATRQASEALSAWYDRGARLAGFHSIKQFLGYDGLMLDGDKVQTTQGLSVPAQDCREAWPLIKRAYKSFSGNNMAFPRGARLGSFVANGIDSDGFLIVGCHRFTRDSVFNLAQRLGLDLH